MVDMVNEMTISIDVLASRGSLLAERDAASFSSFLDEGTGMKAIDDFKQAHDS